MHIPIPHIHANNIYTGSYPESSTQNRNEGNATFDTSLSLSIQETPVHSSITHIHTYMHAVSPPFNSFFSPIPSSPQFHLTSYISSSVVS
ncbi:hypothetical protein EYC80_001071 [Monilinia laxa]|uniref:Uncharacterized protein n=1 Tax=Monilinia laxa TaxID=61186 RepID=A0A5N6K870_MONLA|nr:hypothetical protein EYC80_001071 [Monilinia laxa]